MKFAPLFLLLTGCATVQPYGPVTGEWGGPHIALTLDSTGGRIEYDCASGTIGPVLPVNGRFSTAGRHTPGHGGPVREGEVAANYAARYSGSVSGDRMTLRATVENGVELGPFELRRGAQGNLFRCL